MTTLLVVAGLDPSAGAGILADARVAAAHGVRAVGVVTATTVQDTRGVHAVHPVPADVVAAALARLLDDVAIDAVKIGMIATAPIAAAVADVLALVDAPIVWDPILAASRGVELAEGTPAQLLAALGPRARVVTPNAPELARLVGGRPAVTTDDLVGDAAALVGRGVRAVLAKGGHVPGDPVVDVLVDGGVTTRLAGPRRDAGPLHGTGCVLSTALACALAGGAELGPAARAARAYLDARLIAPLTVGAGARCLV